VYILLDTTGLFSGHVEAVQVLVGSRTKSVAASVLKGFRLPNQRGSDDGEEVQHAKLTALYVAPGNYQQIETRTTEMCIEYSKMMIKMI
jgi:hypothetical protein